MGCLKLSYGEKKYTGLKVVYSNAYENENNCTGAYRYGHNGQEKDDEIFEGAYTAEFWEYDSRTLRRWEKDPIVKPWESPYATFSGNPVFFSDPDGLDSKDPKENSGKANGAKLENGQTAKVTEPSGTNYGTGDNTRSLGNTQQTFNNECNCYIDNSLSESNNNQTASTNKAESNLPNIPNSVDNGNGFIGSAADLTENVVIKNQKEMGLVLAGRFEMNINGKTSVLKEGFRGNQSVPSSAVKSAKTAYVAEFGKNAATKIKILNAAQVIGKYSDIAGIAITGYKMVVLKDESPKNKSDLGFGAAAFIPVVGWGISGAYFGVSLLVGEDNMNMAGQAVTDGFEAVHTQNQNPDATTHIVCFTKGTLIHTPSGFKEIESIVNGDNVYSYNLNNDAIEVDTVVNILSRHTDHIYKIKAGAELIQVTSEHPFYLPSQGWVKAKDLKVGDILKNKSAIEVKITNIDFSEVEVMVYNIEVNKNKNYFVTKSKVLVHNKKILKAKKDKK
jgi:hypothetical protein